MQVYHIAEMVRAVCTQKKEATTILLCTASPPSGLIMKLVCRLIILPKETAEQTSF